jgi:hypothetical protein
MKERINQDNKKIIRDQYTAVLEQINSKIGLIVEGQQDLRKDFDQFKADTKSSLKSIMEYLIRIEAEIMGMKGEIKDLKKSLEKKADLNRLEALEEKILIIEKALIKQRILNGA